MTAADGCRARRTRVGAFRRRTPTRNAIETRPNAPERGRSGQPASGAVGPAVAAGADRFYVRANVDSSGYENRDERSLGVFGQVAGQFQAGRLHVCPSVSVGRSSGPDTDDYAVSTTSVGGGVLFGFIVRETASARIVPSATLSLSRSSSTFDWGEEFELGKVTGTGKALP